MFYIFEKGISGKYLILFYGIGGDEYFLLDIVYFFVLNSMLFFFCGMV